MTTSIYRRPIIIGDAALARAIPDQAARLAFTARHASAAAWARLSQCTKLADGSEVYFPALLPLHARAEVDRMFGPRPGLLERAAKKARTVLARSTT